jgi:hypothetical protein
MARDERFLGGVPIRRVFDGASHLIEPPPGAGGAPGAARRVASGRGAIESHFELSAFHDGSFRSRR